MSKDLKLVAEYKKQKAIYNKIVAQKLNEAAINAQKQVADDCKEKIEDDAEYKIHNAFMAGIRIKPTVRNSWIFYISPKNQEKNHRNI